MILPSGIPTEDSSAAPYIEQKDVVLCRSGIQLYAHSELEPWIEEGNRPPAPKAVYREYRPASVVVKAKELFRSLPVTKEHPAEWVGPDNFKALAGGVLDRDVEVVALDGESEGEIGLKSNITFFTRELYDYYLSNKEVSVGYTCRKRFVDNPEEAGYDIILEEITEVNHLAITRAGRGGSSVAVIDTITGGIKSMRTGFFAFLAGKKRKESKESKESRNSALSFGRSVVEAVKAGGTEEALKGVLDSMSVLKDCDAKRVLADAVKDCFDNKDMALSDEEGAASALDSMWREVHGETVGEIAKAFAKLAKDSAASEEEASEEEEEKAEDAASEEEASDAASEEEEEKAEDAASEKEGGKEKDGRCGCGGHCGCHDSAAYASKDDLVAFKEEMKRMVEQTVKECLGIKDSAAPKGSALDSDTAREQALPRDYASFLDN